MSLRALGNLPARLTLTDSDTGREVCFREVYGLEVVIHHDETGATAGGVTVIAPWVDLLAPAAVNLGDPTHQPAEVTRAIGRRT